MSRLETDFKTIDPDGGDQDSASSCYGELNEPVTAHIPRARQPLTWRGLACALAIVGAAACGVVWILG